jgi:hypothetical protein
MPEETLKRFSAIFNPPKPSPCDIAYYTGGTSIEWEPENQSLGGSEQAVVHLATEWVKLGKSVIVYGNFLKNTEYQGVAYKSWKEFDWGATYDTVILWRPSGVNCSLQFALKAKRILVDFHDTFQYFRFDYSTYAHKIDEFMFKSQFHVKSYEKQFGELKKPYKVIPNGVRIEQFAEKPDGVVRNPYRFCYCSLYDRGLEDILKHVWPVIFQAEPRAELHVYYGMDGIRDQKLLMFLMGQPGVMDHGRRDSETIRREKWMSTFHLYLTKTDSEIDCISIRESVAAGCIPIISRHGVFNEREGVHINIDGSPEQFQKAAHGIVQLMKTPGLQSLLKIKPETTTWEKVAKEWSPYI